jgi:hypothetical protein
MLPEWQERWRRSLSHWSGNVLLMVGDESCILHFEGSELRLVNQIIDAVEVIQLTPELFIQVVFGHRPVGWALQQHGQFGNNDLLSVLKVLFLEDHTWIPASDWF